MNTGLLDGTKAFRDFRTEIENGLSNAYLLLTPDTEAAHRLFFMLADAILKNDGAGESVALKLQADAHSDVKFYKNAGKMSVKDAAEMVADVFVKPIEGKRKLYFLERADAMSASVQNKLLKTLEEPPVNVTIFLSASSETALLSTIRSRAKKFFLDAFSTEALKNELIAMGEEEENAETVALTANGSLTDAMRFASDEAFLARYRETFEMLLTLKKSSEIPGYLNVPLFKKENALETYDFIERILWDAVRVGLGSGGEALKSGRAEDYRAVAKNLSPAAAAVISGLCNEARKKIQLNISAATASETLLFGILEAKFKWQ